jgi:hypothetical protein
MVDAPGEFSTNIKISLLCIYFLYIAASSSLLLIVNLINIIYLLCVKSLLSCILHQIDEHFLTS